MSGLFRFLRYVVGLGLVMVAGAITEANVTKEALVMYFTSPAFLVSFMFILVGFVIIKFGE